MLKTLILILVVGIWVAIDYQLMGLKDAVNVVFDLPYGWVLCRLWQNLGACDL